MICCCSCCPRLKRRPLLPLHWQPSVVPICAVAWLQQQTQDDSSLKTLGNMKTTFNWYGATRAHCWNWSAATVVRVTDNFQSVVRLFCCLYWHGPLPTTCSFSRLRYTWISAALKLPAKPWVQLEACGLSLDAAQVRGFPHWHNRSGNCVPSGRAIWSGRSRNCWSAASSLDTGVTLTWLDSAVQQHWN